MKKSVKIVLWTALALIGAGIVLFLVGLLVTKGDFSKISTVEYENRQRTVEEEFTDISIEQYTDNVYVYPTTESVCRIDYMQSENILQSIAVQDGVLRIAEQDNRKWYECVGIFWGNKEMCIYLPQAEYNAVKIKASSGSVEIASGFTFASVDVRVESGDINLSADAHTDIKLTAQSGNVDVKNASAASLTATAQSGAIRLENVTAKDSVSLGVQSGEIIATGVTCSGFTASTQSGDVQLENVLSAGITEIRTQSGDIHLHACDGAAYRIIAQSGSVKGTVRSAKVFYASTKSGSVNVPQSNEGGMFEVNTQSGDIDLRVAE